MRGVRDCRKIKDSDKPSYVHLRCQAHPASSQTLLDDDVPGSHCATAPCHPHATVHALLLYTVVTVVTLCFVPSRPASTCACSRQRQHSSLGVPRAGQKSNLHPFRARDLKYTRCLLQAGDRPPLAVASMRALLTPTTAATSVIVLTPQALHNSFAMQREHVQKHAQQSRMQSRLQDRLLVSCLHQRVPV